MSRCFPFPPPGYERKTKEDDTDLLKKVKTYAFELAVIRYVHVKLYVEMEPFADTLSTSGVCIGCGGGM